MSTIFYLLIIICRVVILQCSGYGLTIAHKRASRMFWHSSRADTLRLQSNYTTCQDTNQQRDGHTHIHTLQTGKHANMHTCVHIMLMCTYTFTHRCMRECIHVLTHIHALTHTALNAFSAYYFCNTHTTMWWGISVRAAQFLVPSNS